MFLQNPVLEGNLGDALSAVLDEVAHLIGATRAPCGAIAVRM